MLVKYESVFNGHIYTLIAFTNKNEAICEVSGARDDVLLKAKLAIKLNDLYKANKFTVYDCYSEQTDIPVIEFNGE